MPPSEKSTHIFNSQIWQHEALLLPLSADGQLVDMLMGYRWTFDPAPLPRRART